MLHDGHSRARHIKDHKGTRRWATHEQWEVASQGKHKQNSKTVRTFIKLIRETLSPKQIIAAIHCSVETHIERRVLGKSRDLFTSIMACCIFLSSLVPSHPPSTRSVGLVAKLLYSKWRTVKPNSLAPSPTAPLVKPKRLTGDEAMFLSSNYNAGFSTLYSNLIS